MRQDLDRKAARPREGKRFGRRPSRTLSASVVRLGLSALRLVYRLRLGRLLGHRFLLFTFANAKKDAWREQALEVVEWDPRRRSAVVIALRGTDAPWYVAAFDGRARSVRIADLEIHPKVRRVEGEEAFRVFSDFERRNRLLMPLSRPVISGLVGFRYDGSPRARRRLLDRMPLVELSAEPGARAS
jgi:hypothetical protein